jgi:hypothetical protein
VNRTNQHLFDSVTTLKINYNVIPINEAQGFEKMCYILRATYNHPEFEEGVFRLTGLLKVNHWVKLWVPTNVWKKILNS